LTQCAEGALNGGLTILTIATLGGTSELDVAADGSELAVDEGGSRPPADVEVIHTTSSHLFWDPYLNQWIPADHLKKGERLKAPNGRQATADGGSVPADHVGWTWDLTVPGNNDHDFYIETVTGAVLVHNASSAYVPPPPGKVLPGFPDAKYISNRGGRATWTDGITTLQWHYQHGAVEMYSKNGTHLGEFDPNDGSQNKPGDPSRSPSGC
jgi:hypothetical protein